MNWIKVEDRLPEEKKTVLVCTDSKEMCTALILKNYDNIEWVDSSWCYSLYEVTHWMELPELPK